jgi:hypothetical protein
MTAYSVRLTFHRRAEKRSFIDCRLEVEECLSISSEMRDHDDILSVVIGAKHSATGNKSDSKDAVGMSEKRRAFEENKRGSPVFNWQNGFSALIGHDGALQVFDGRTGCRVPQAEVESVLRRAPTGAPLTIKAWVSPH